MRPGGVHDGDDVLRQLRRDVHPFRGLPQGEDRLPVRHRLQLAAGLLHLEGHPDLLLRRRVPQGELHEESVDLRLGQRVGPEGVDGVLSGQDHEGLLQAVGPGIHGDLLFLHGLQQARLGLGRGPVDLVGQDDAAHDRAGAELEFAGLLIVDGKAGDVRGHDVRGELDALRGAGDGAGQSRDQARFAHAGHVLDEHVAAADQGRDHQLHHAPFSDDHRFDVVHDGANGFCAEVRLFGGKGEVFRFLHCLSSASMWSTGEHSRCMRPSGPRCSTILMRTP